MDSYNKLKQVIIETIGQLYPNNIDINNIILEVPKDLSHGDLSTNFAMVIAKQLHQSPKIIAENFRNTINKSDFIENIEIAGPGFINFTLTNLAWQTTISSILQLGLDYGKSKIGKDKKINIEFVSANPTGPMHIGHARGAVYGDALARLLIKAGFSVVKEFYMNDYGSQIETLVKSAYIRYLEFVNATPITIPEGLYPGDYLIPVGQELYNRYHDELVKYKEEEYIPLLKQFVVDKMMELIKQDLKDLNIEHDVFFSEKELHETKAIDKAVEQLKAKGLIYSGKLAAPKGKLPDDWLEREQLLFKSTDFSDDQDRPLQKANAQWTYFAADVAYTKNKIDRGFDRLVMILGADHGGYVKRFEAVVKAFNENIKIDIKLCQLVNFIKDGEPVKMSKRAGNFTTVRDVINEVGKDIIRFIMLTRKNDATMDFDMDKVKEQSKDNPVFYVQYAYVRTRSIIENVKEQLPAAYTIFEENNFNVCLLNNKEELRLIKILASWPRIIENAAQHYEPHRVAFYLQNLSAEFHSFWNLGKEDNELRFIINNNIDLTSARLALVKSIQIVIHSGLELLGVKPLEHM